MSPSIPSSVIIVGSGVFGLGTAYALALRPEYEKTKITILERVPFPASDGSSIDSSRIIRADYADLVYGQLMSEAMPHWEGEYGADGRFSQCGLCLVEDIESGDSTEVESFVDEALFNVTEKLGLKLGDRENGADVTKFSDEAGAKKLYASTMGGVVGKKGYVNWTSGWAHAENGVRFLRQKAEATGRITFHTAEVERLLFDGDSVSGVEVITGDQLLADLTVLATGAWTPKLIDLRGIASATGQVLAYLDITAEEEARLSAPHHPVILRGNDGLFIIPPTNRTLKVARHGFGYANPVTIPHPEKPRSLGETITVSIPRTRHDDPDTKIPAEGEAACRAFLAQAIPSLADRPFSHSRICWYTDTIEGDWLITYHPRYAKLFIATGGSGHGYKFLPIIGERIVDVIQGRERDALGRELRERWRWPERRIEDDHVWTNDWRGTSAPKGMILDEEYKKPYPQPAQV